MQRLLRIVVYVLVVFGAMTQPAHAQELKLATLAPDGSNWMDEMRAAADRISERTDGQVRIRFYPGGVMGDAGAVLRRIRLGQLHGGAFTLGDLASVAPAADLYSLPFVFETLGEVEAVRKEFDPLILDALEEGGMIAPAISLGGFAYLFSRRRLPAREEDPIDSGLRVWVPQGDDLSRKTLENAGTTPVPMPLAEVYTSLQTGAINTIANTPSATIILQWHTRLRYMLDMPLLMTAGTVAFDAGALDRLEDSHRELLLDEFGEVLGRIERSSHEDNSQALDALRDQGIEILVPDPAQSARWRELAEQTRHEFVDRGRLKLPHLELLQDRLEELRESD